MDKQVDNERVAWKMLIAQWKKQLGLVWYGLIGAGIIIR
jgi:hypothetical protein